jgi:aminopeptidase-like protein
MSHLRPGHSAAALVKGRDKILNIAELRVLLESVGVGDEIYRLICDLFPLCRSITGNGLRETLRTVAREIPLKIQEIPSGTKVLDWTIPKEWNIGDAYIKNAKGEKVIDFANSNLHVVSYSVPVKKRMPLQELKRHLHTLPERPDWIPFRASYYKENWGSA